MNRNQMKKIFETKVIQVGSEAQNMIQDANMLILFGEEAPHHLFSVGNEERQRVINARRIFIG